MKKASLVLLQLFCLVVLFSTTAYSASEFTASDSTVSSNLTLVCDYRVQTTSLNATAGGTNIAIPIVISNGCPVPVSEHRPPSWLSGICINITGNPTCYISVQPNAGPARSGTITFQTPFGSPDPGSFTINVNQGSGCTYNLGSNSLDISSAGGSDNFSVTISSSECVWTPISNVNWITTTTETFPSGNGRVFFSVAANPGSARTGIITIGNKTFTVNQTGAVDCTYSINPTSIQAGAAGGDTGFNLTTQTGCNWTAQSNADWIAVLTPTGTNSGRVNYSVQPNSGQARSGTITVAGQTFTINQDSGIAPPVELIMASGIMIDQNFKPIHGAVVTFVHARTGEIRTARTNPFGHFHFPNIELGQQYNASVTHKRYRFGGARAVNYFSSSLSVVFTANPEQ